MKFGSGDLHVLLLIICKFRERRCFSCGRVVKRCDISDVKRLLCDACVKRHTVDRTSPVIVVCRPMHRAAYYMLFGTLKFR